ncbi:MAG: cytochrome c554 and C-prime [Leptospira sp.]|nr:cytochrome c554 and C-prime [Leptospira sp.]
MILYRLFIFLFLAGMCFLILICSPGIRFTENNNHRWTKAVEPISFQPSQDLASNQITGELWESSTDCKTCHENIYENWSKSRHNVAYSNPLYQVSHKKEPMAWCLNCHSPLMEPGNDPKDFSGRFQSEDGVSCITCHVRDGNILTAEIPKEPKGVHAYKEVSQMKESEFCGNCHQFNFPTIDSLSESKPLEYSNLPMQNTLEEWKESPYYPRKNCQSCHLFPKKKRSHSFSGGHDAEYLNQSFELELIPIIGNEFTIRVRGINIGHHFPTGDLFRSLRIRIKKEDGSFVDEIILKKHYIPSEKDASSKDAARVLYEDTSLNLFSKDSNYSVRDISWRYEGVERKLIYELEMDYQSGENHFFNQLPYKETFRKFLKGQWILPEMSKDKG